MERLEKKVIKGNIYYYYSKWERVNGKCRRVWQKYLGKLEDIANAVDENGPTPQYVEVFQFGLPSTLWQECNLANVINIVDKLCPKRAQGLSIGEYIAIAAINRAIHPISKHLMFDWFSKTTLLRHFPNASSNALTSQKFWDHMDHIEPKTIPSIWREIISGVIERENIELSSLCYDGTNFYTFIDTFNSRSSIAKRGKNKQGRFNLRQVSYALFCSADGQVPLYYDVYEGNRHDAKQFPLMVQQFYDFLKNNFDKEIRDLQLTLIFDKGNNSNSNFSLIDTLKLHYVGSIKLSEVKELAAISNKDPIFVSCKTMGLENTKAFRVTQQLYGKKRTIIVTYNQKLFNTQWLTLHNDIKQAVADLNALENKLHDRANGLIKKGKCPTIDSIKQACTNILSRQYMKDVINYSVSAYANGTPKLDYELDNEAINKLSDTYLGKNVIITDREQWSNENIILAYRSQFNIENIFKEMKDREIGNWWPLYHWTDQKIKVHSFYCTIALLLRALAHRRVKKAGLEISMKRMLEELNSIQEVIVVYPDRGKTKKERHHTVLSKTSELQQSLLSVLRLQGAKSIRVDSNS